MKRGFTLIELLAVIVILAIISLIATPIVLDIIEDTKKSAIKRSSELYIKAVELSIAKASMDNIDITTCNVEDKNLKCGEKEYKIELEGEPPKEVEIKVTKEGKVYTAIKTDGYCIIKSESENSYSYKKIVESIKDSNKEITNNMCSLDPYTSEGCFAFDESTGTITDYYRNDNECDDKVVIPKKINNIVVRVIGQNAFLSKSLTSVIIPNTVITIDVNAFRQNSLYQVIIPEGVMHIKTASFAYNKIQNLSLPSSVIEITPNAFKRNLLPQEQAYIYKRNSDGSIDYSTIIAYGGNSKNIIIPSEKNGVKLLEIGESAFTDYQLESIDIPNTVTKIGNSAFRQNSLNQVTIPESVTNIGSAAFFSNPLETVNIKTKQENVTMANNSFGSFDTNNIVWDYVE